MLPLQPELSLARVCLSIAFILITAGTALAQSVSYETRPEGLAQVERLTAQAMRLFKSGQTKAALAKFQSAADQAHAHLGPSDHRYIQSLSNLALVYEVSGSLQRSEQIYRKALKITDTQSQSHTLQRANLQNNLAAVLIQQCRITDAHQLYRQALQLSEKTLGPQHNDTVMIRDNVHALDRYLGTPSSGKAAIVKTRLDGNGDISSLLERCVS